MGFLWIQCRQGNAYYQSPQWGTSISEKKPGNFFPLCSTGNEFGDLQIFYLFLINSITAVLLRKFGNYL
jgi:hypothetical protein